jgi:hypothetical protein
MVSHTLSQPDCLESNELLGVNHAMFQCFSISRSNVRTPITFVIGQISALSLAKLFYLFPDLPYSAEPKGSL